jgi:uncharacterized protein YbcI
MPGFEFRYRLSGGLPTVQSVLSSSTLPLISGDMLSFADGKVGLATSDHPALVGAAVDGEPGDPAASVRVITDADAVYAISDRHLRLRGAGLDLQGASGDQGVSTGVSGALIVVLDTAAGAETLVRIGDGRHHGIEPEPEQERVTHGELNAAIARAVVSYHHEHLGRGPTKAQAFFSRDVVVVMLGDGLTATERTLASVGRGDAVLEMRQALRDTMREQLVSKIEALTGCKVLALLSATHLEPDVAADIFVLDRPIAGEPEAR